MKKKLLFVLLALACCFACAWVFAACGDDTPAHTHTMAYHSAKAPTCTEDGSVEYWSCSDCGKNFSDEVGEKEITTVTVPAKGHSFGEWQTVREATCMEEGEQTRSCSACGEVETNKLPLVAHGLIERKATNATCTKDGNTAYWECETCGKYFEDKDGKQEITDKTSVIIAAHHVYGDSWQHNETEHWQVCENCGEPAEKQEHKLGEDYSCEVCGYEIPLYTVDDDGEYIFNIPAMVDVLTNWIQGDNQYSKDYLAEFWMTENARLVKVLYLNANINYNFGVIVIAEINGERNSTTINFNDENFYIKIQDKTIKTMNDLKKYLWSTNYKQFRPENSITYEYTTIDATPAQLSEFNLMTKNILTKIATKGFQTESIKNPYQNPIPEYANAEVLFGFKTEAGGMVAGLDFGYFQSWEQYYVLNINGNLEFVKIGIASSVTVGDYVATEKGNVLSANDKGYLLNVNLFERTPIAAENTELFDGIIKSESVTVGGLRYDIVGDCAVVAPLQSDTISGNVNIPAQITFQNKTYAVTAIAGCAFYNNDTITAVTIPESVTEIGEAAFYSCGELTNVILPNNINSIENDVFSYCQKLTTLIIPDGVKSIGNYAFISCHSLSNITIPNSITSIGNQAFDFCSSLVDIIYKGTKEEWKAIEGRPTWTNYTSNFIVHCTDGEITKD